jgi:hypothetical protein
MERAFLAAFRRLPADAAPANARARTAVPSQRETDFVFERIPPRHA